MESIDRRRWKYQDLLKIIIQVKSGYTVGVLWYNTNAIIMFKFTVKRDDDPDAAKYIRFHQNPKY